MISPPFLTWNGLHRADCKLGRCSVNTCLMNYLINILINLSSDSLITKWAASSQPNVPLSKQENWDNFSSQWALLNRCYSTPIQLGVE
jgi:hypothetical protein